MHSQLSLLLIFTAFSAIFFLSGSASVLLTTSPPSSALATTGTTSTSSNPPATALLPRAPEQQSDAPFARCRCRALGMTFYDCLFYQILNWPTEQNFVRRLHDELRKCGHLDFGLRKYYIPERESGLGAFVYFRLPFVHKDRCWRRAIARALGTTGVECSFSYAMRDDPQAWWEDMVRANRRHASRPYDYTFFIDH